MWDVRITDYYKSRIDRLNKEGRLSSFLLKVGWIAMFAGIPFGSGAVALPLLLVGKIAKKSIKMEKNIPIILMNLFIFASLISIINAQRKLFTLGSVVSIFLMTYLIYPETNYIISRKSFWDLLIKIFILSSVISSIYALYVYFTGLNGRARTLFTGENGLGTVMILSIIWILAYFVHTSGRQKLLAGMSLIITSMALLFSFSRGAWLGTMGGLLLYGLCQKRARLKVVILILIMSVLLFGYPPLFHRLSSIIDLSYSSNQERIYIWESTWRMIKDHPVIGMGMGNYVSFYKWYIMPGSKITDASFAHNIFLQIWAECGIGALFAFAGIIIFTLLKGISLVKSPDSSFKTIGLASLAAFVGILIHSQVDCTIYSMHIGPIFWLLAGIIFYSEKSVHWR